MLGYELCNIFFFQICLHAYIYHWWEGLRRRTSSKANTSRLIVEDNAAICNVLALMLYTYVDSLYHSWQLQCVMKALSDGLK